MNIVLDKLSKKYAQAFVNVHAQTLDQQTIEKIDMFNAYIYKHRNALLYVQIVTLDDERTKNRFNELLATFNLEGLLRPLIDLLIEHKRIFLFSNVLKWIAALSLELLNIEKYTIETAHPLEEQQLSEIVNYLKKKTKKDIIYKTVLNRHLIAGIKVYSDTLGFEHSIRKQLRALKSIV